MTDDKVVVENVNVPGHTERVDAAKYRAMREAYLATLTTDDPGMTAAEAKEALLPVLDQELFPGGAKSGWWMKTVQLDLEAKGLVQRAPTKPLRFRKV
ncbi:DUF6958 family protein [Shimia ponticola]|uniref:DUF6958 family protein n=1 Tax=Shimia ponticola TaxID=2582893 RepID=UPI0011BE5A3D|nr:hypothetical protein [Shimia ponticola]